MTDIQKDCWLTLIALRILRDKFQAHEAEWRLAALKARQYLQSKGIVGID